MILWGVGRKAVAGTDTFPVLMKSQRRLGTHSSHPSQQCHRGNQPTPLQTGHNTRPISGSRITTVTDKFVRFEVFTALTMKNGVFWDKRIKFVPHRKHVSATEPIRLKLRNTSCCHCGDYEYAPLLDVTSCGCCKNRRFG
jgi:hypothetical protein